ncbi:MAG: hypothetical protein IJR46_07320 [Neisseriaceae bacterium]|nr:hypothetical protein [Neisseriaceae bacterium]
MKKLTLLSIVMLGLTACASNQATHQHEHHTHANHSHENHSHENHQMPEFMKNMTEKERQDYMQGMHNAMQQMTPEERKKFQQDMQKQMHPNGGHDHGDGEHHCQHNHDDSKAKKDSKTKK